MLDIVNIDPIELLSILSMFENIRVLKLKFIQNYGLFRFNDSKHREKHTMTSCKMNNLAELSIAGCSFRWENIVDIILFAINLRKLHIHACGVYLNIELFQKLARLRIMKLKQNTLLTIYTDNTNCNDPVNKTFFFLFLSYYKIRFQVHNIIIL